MNNNCFLFRIANRNIKSDFLYKLGFLTLFFPVQRSGLFPEFKETPVHQILMNRLSRMSTAFAIRRAYPDGIRNPK